MAASEIMGLRDWRLSDRHRQWGDDCPACDLDYILVDYDRAVPVALVEFKHCSPKGSTTVRDNASLRAFRNLGDMACLPAWVAVYRPWTWSFKIFPCNQKAHEIWGDDECVYVTELEYVRKLYALRGREVPADVAASLNATHNNLPGEEEDFGYLTRQVAPIKDAEIGAAVMEVKGD